MSFYEELKKGQKEFGHDVAAIINTIILTFVYIFGVGFTHLFSLLFNKKFLEKEEKKGSYWEDLNLEKKELEEYYRQF